MSRVEEASSLALVMLLGLAHAGCGGDPAPAPVPPDARVLTKYPEVMELADGDPVELIVGPQFGVMFQLGIETHGIDPTRPHFDWTISVDGVVENQSSFGSPLRPSTDDKSAFELPAVPLVLKDIAPMDLDKYAGKDVIIQVDILDTMNVPFKILVHCVATK